MRSFIPMVMLAFATAAVAQSGPTMEMLDPGAGGGAPEARLFDAARSKQSQLGIGRAVGSIVEKRLPGGTLYSRLFSFPGDAGAAHAFLASSEGPSICHIRMPRGVNASRLATFVDACVKRMGLQGAARPRPASAGRAPQDAGVPGSHPENWRAVSGVYFYRGVSLGYGGAMIMVFRPVVLFNDSSYYEIDDAPLEDIDLAAERRAHPKRFGRWSRRGATFTLFDEKGRGHDYAMGTGNFFKAYPATGNSGLAGSYANVSGGGNVALGGTTGYLADSRMTFGASGDFTTGQSVAFSQSADQTGVAITGYDRNRAKGGGRYTTDRYTLTLAYADGTRKRRFFCFSSNGATGAIDRSMIFIGDSGYTQKK